MKIYVIIGTVVGVLLFCSMFVFVIGMFFSPKLRAKMMGNQIKSMKYMLDDNKDKLTDIATTTGGIAAQSFNNIINENEDALRNSTNKVSDIAAPAIEKTTRAIKKGFTESDNVYCKHCGASIDSDSKFCKACGKEQ